MDGAASEASVVGALGQHKPWIPGNSSWLRVANTSFEYIVITAL